jgi:hypothetical protein
VELPHQLLNASVVELNVDVPQFRVVVAGAEAGLRADGRKFAGGYEKPTMSTHAPDAQTWLELHAAGALHTPLPLHVCTPLPKHCVAPGVHTPVHAPDTHAEDTQALALPHCPDELHVSTLLPLHRAAPGAQTPVHVPLTQA